MPYHFYRLSVLIAGVGLLAFGWLGDLIRGEPELDIGVMQGAAVFWGAVLILSGVFYGRSVEIKKVVASYVSSAVVSFVSYDREKIRQSWVIIFFVSLAFIFYIEKIILGANAPIRFHDNFDADFPRLLDYGNLLLEFGFFGWYPNLSGGIPSYSYHYAPIDPLALLSVIVPPWAIYSLLVLAWMALAGIGAYLFLFRLMSLPHWVGLFGGILFALNTQIHIYSAHTHIAFIHLFPLFFVSVSGMLFKTRSPLRVAISIFVGIGTLSVAFPDLTLVKFSVAHFVVIYLLWGNSWRHFVRACIGAMLVWGGYAMFELPVLYSLLNFEEHVQRDYGFRDAITQTPVYWQSLVGKNGFANLLTKAGGLLMIFVVIVLAVFSKRVAKWGVACLLMGGGGAIFGSNLATYLPFLQKMDMQHLNFVWPFLFTVTLSLTVYECWREKISMSAVVLAIGITGILCFSLGRFFDIVIFRSTALMFLNIGVAVTIIGILLIWKSQSNTNKKVKVWGLGARTLITITSVAALVTVGSVRLERINREHDDYLPVYGERDLKSYLPSEFGPYRFGVIHPVHPAFLYMNGVEGVDGRSPVFFGRYKELFATAISRQFMSQKDKDLFRSYFYDLYLGYDVEKFNTTLLRMMNLKYIVSLYELPELSDWSLVNTIEYDTPPYRFIHNGKKLFLYELSDTFERGYLVRNARIFGSDSEVLDALSKETVEGLLKHVYLSEEDGNITIQEQGDSLSRTDEEMGRIKLTEYTPDKIVFSVENIHPVFVVVSNNYYPKWKARVDGVEVPVLRANHTFQAIQIGQSGHHEVIFEFIDPALWWAHVGLPIGLLLISMGVVWNVRAGFTGSRMKYETD